MFRDQRGASTVVASTDGYSGKSEIRNTPYQWKLNMPNSHGLRLAKARYSWLTVGILSFIPSLFFNPEGAIGGGFDGYTGWPWPLLAFALFPIWSAPIYLICNRTYRGLLDAVIVYSAMDILVNERWHGSLAVIFHGAEVAIHLRHLAEIILFYAAYYGLLHIVVYLIAHLVRLARRRPPDNCP
jgi:hypothetical protein